MSTVANRRLLSRLHRDLKELLEQPYPGVTVFTNDANIRRFCLVLTPPSGPFTGMNLHFDVELPLDWPGVPPAVRSSVHGIDHPNLYGGYICCDLLKPMDWLEAGYNGGYTPALTLRGLFLQFLTFFSSTKVEQDYGGVIEIGEKVDVTYVEEKEFLAARRPWRINPPSRFVLEARWNEDPNPEVVITVKPDQPAGMVHTVKGEPNPQRIHKLEKPNPRWARTLEEVVRWKCPKCPYGSKELPHVQKNTQGATSNAQSFDQSRPPPSCQLHLLDDDVLLEIAEQLASESLITFGRAYPRFHSLTSAHHILLQREVHCFFLKTQLRDGILGVGVAVDYGARSLASDFDWLSLEAFETHKVRKSIQKRDFEFFLPLAFNKPHFERAKKEIWQRVHLLDKTVRDADAEVQGRMAARRGASGRGRGPSPVAAPRAHHDSLKVIYKMMNNIVVSLMKSCDDALVGNGRRPSSNVGLITASERAIISYCHLIHLLICLSRSYPIVLKDAIARIQAFIKSPNNRTKGVEPDMGELIVVMTLVLIMSPPGSANKAPTWGMLNGPFLEEAITRNARWVLKDAPELEVMEQGLSEYRLQTTFNKSKTSLRLLMFQITFLDLFIQTYHKIGIQALDENYGFPVKELPELMVEEIKGIYKVDSWPDFFGKVRYQKAKESFTKESFSGMLRAAIKQSGERKYHQPAGWGRLQDLVKSRSDLEREARVGSARTPIAR